MQLDQENRGFSFRHDGPLDMRMDAQETLTAADIVNKWPEARLGEALRDLGEEPFWRKISKAIVEARKNKKISTTKQLVDIVLSVYPKAMRRKIHPATLVFQALRMCVNKELESIEVAIKAAIKHLAPGGRIGVISFHSLEDRIVKNIFKEASLPTRDAKGNKIEPAQLELLTKKPISPGFQEIKRNKRARSARLRFAQKVTVS